MFELKGKYNNCKIFTDNVDNETISQLMSLLNQEYVKDLQIRIMPDTHAGAGCTIGTTMTIKDKIVPDLVGVDIGCSVIAAKLEETDIDLKLLDNIIHEYVPSGFSIHDTPIAKSNIDKIIAPIDIDRAYKSIGTLGGGNHFIEANKDSKGYIWLVVHTGSRHLGMEVCKYYQELAYKKITSNKSEIDEIIDRLKAEKRQHEIQETINKLKTKNTKIPKELCYVQNDDFDNYIHDMKLTQEHAKINRQTIIDIIVKHMGFHIIDMIDTMHNYIDIDKMILRKGAVSAQKDEKLIIPMNMRDGSLICIGKGNPDWNYSAPHGAGRIMSRGQAKEKISIDEYKQSMKGIYTSCISTSTIDESPMVYKPMKEIINNINDTVDITDVIKPIYNFKAN